MIQRNYYRSRYMGFRKALTITHSAGGAYVSGVWSSGILSTVQVQASVLPAKPEEIIDQAMGRHTAGMMKMYTSTSLTVLGDGGAAVQPDRFVWLGKEYMLVGKSSSQMGVLPHYKYLCAEVDPGEQIVV